MSRAILFLTLTTAALMGAIVSYAMSKLGQKLAKKVGALDIPGGRKKHQKPTALLGGFGIGCSVVLMMYVAWNMGWFSGGLVREQQLWGIAAGILVLMIGGAADDIRPLPARVQILFPILASACVILGGTGFVQVTNVFSRGAVNLIWWKWHAFSFPADVLTLVWLIVATYALKIQDGLDGLVTGLGIIGSSLVAALSSTVAFYQPAVAILSGVVGGAFAGFLPFNAPPAKQFLGESGSTMAGFLLGVLAILSSAKVAIALCVLAIPIADIAIVIYGRMRRGVPWHQGDRSHLHFRLLAAGLSPKLVVLLLWGISATAGIMALSVQTRGKIFIVCSLIGFTIFASWTSSALAKKRGKEI